MTWLYLEFLRAQFAIALIESAVNTRNAIQEPVDVRHLQQHANETAKRLAEAPE